MWVLLRWVDCLCPSLCPPPPLAASSPRCHANCCSTCGRMAVSRSPAPPPPRAVGVGEGGLVRQNTGADFHYSGLWKGVAVVAWGR